MICERAHDIHAYHDGELSPAKVAAIEAHLRDCAACAELLAELRQLSQLVAAAPMVDMPPAAMKRMQQAWWAAQDRGVLRVASWLTAAAAAVILAAVMYSSPGDRGEPMTTANAPQLVALMQQSSPTFQQDADEPQDELLIATQYIANDLSAVAEGQVTP
jgi:anti-sigma factor RsiW